jgi:anti-sigma B factor antagonist
VEIEKVSQGDKTILYVTGRIDTKTSPEFQQIIDEALDANEIVLEFNFKGVEYLSSAGLRAILYTQKKINNIPNASLAITEVNESVMEIFDMTGFSDFLTIIAQ